MRVGAKSLVVVSENPEITLFCNFKFAKNGVYGGQTSLIFIILMSSFCY